MRRPPNEDDDIVTAFRDGVVTLRKNKRIDGFTNSLQEIGYQGVRSGDLVIHAMDAFAGAIGVSDSNGKSTPVYSVCAPLEGLSISAYYGHLLRHMALSGFILSLSKGIRERSTEFRWSEAGNVELPVPTINEQAAIVAFLDLETAKVDALVGEQERLIELLKEKRQAVISHAVTKGLNPQAPMKDSGIEWLGEVPEHWTHCTLRHLVESVTSGPRGWSELTADEGAIFFQSQNIGRSMKPVFDDFKTISAPHDTDAERARLKEGDVVVCITGARTGAVAHIDDLIETTYINQHVCLIRPIIEIVESRFLSYYLWSFYGQEQLNSAMYGLKQGLSLDDIKDVFLPIPSGFEQLAIVAYLDDQTAKIDTLITEAERAIELLKEHRSALISAAVTGKIDVRGLVASIETTTENAA